MNSIGINDKGARRERGGFERFYTKCASGRFGESAWYYDAGMRPHLTEIKAACGAASFLPLRDARTEQ